MKINISPALLKAFPEMNIGFVLAKIVVTDSHPYSESLKDTLEEIVTRAGISAKDYAQNPNIAGWREVFKSMGVKPKRYPSSVEALVKRNVKGQKTWNVSNVVDLYNCCSVQTLCPMGGYDVDKIKGDILLRYGVQGETFRPLGARQDVQVEAEHVVYSDNERVICWLWNHKDAEFTCITKDTQCAIFFIDAAFKLTNVTMDGAVQNFSDHLRHIGAAVIEKGVLNSSSSSVELHIPTAAELSSIALPEVSDAPPMLSTPPLVTKPMVDNKKRAVSGAYRYPTESISPLLLTGEQLAKEPPLSFITLCATASREKVEAVLRHNSDLLMVRDSGGNTPFMHAALNGNMTVLKALYERDPGGIDVVNSFGQTALFLAIKGNQEDAVRFLLLKKARTDIRDKKELTPLQYARQRHLQHAAIIEGLEQCSLSTQASLAPQSVFSQRPTVHDLFKCIDENELEQARRILPRLGRECSNDQGVTPLMRASFMGRQKFVTMLTEAGHDVNVEDKHGKNAYRYAIEGGHNDLAGKLLTDFGAKTDTRDSIALTFTMGGGNP